MVVDVASVYSMSDTIRRIATIASFVKGVLLWSILTQYMQPRKNRHYPIGSISNKLSSSPIERIVVPYVAFAFSPLGNSFSNLHFQASNPHSRPTLTLSHSLKTHTLTPTG
jgi:hypothetical protein